MAPWLKAWLGAPPGPGHSLQHLAMSRAPPPYEDEGSSADGTLGVRSLLILGRFWPPFFLNFPKEAMEAYTPEVPDALRDYIAIVFTSAITSTLVEALFSCVPSLDVACVIVQAVRGWCCCCRHMAYLKSQHHARMTDETMVSNIGAKDFPDPTDNPERPLEKLEIDPEVALGHELSYGY